MYEANNPIEDRFGFITRGAFRCSRQSERISVILTVIVTVIVFIIFYYVWGEQLLYIYTMHYDDGSGTLATSHIQYFALVFSIVTFIIFAVGFTVISFILRGVEYSYTADGNVFSFRSAKDNVPKTDIHYNDVIAVRFEERKLFGFIKRGFTVTVITHTLGTVTLEYLFNRSITSKTPENTPFHIIKVRSEATDKALTRTEG